jgi:hypothetical protein
METKGIFMHWLLFKPLRFARGAANPHFSNRAL